MELRLFASRNTNTFTSSILGALLITAVLGKSVPTQKTCSPGEFYLAHPNYCTKFQHCVLGVPMERDCPLGTVFNQRFSVCVMAGSELDTCTPYHVTRECERGTLELIPHPTKCHGYFNCSDPVPIHMGSHFNNEYEKECTWPLYFDIRLKTCVGYQNAVCGQGRVRAIWYCDYRKNQCPVAMCRPCWVDHPSCVGKQDGLWPLDHWHSPQSFVECKSQRAVDGIQFCPENQIFDANHRKCQLPSEK